MKDRDHLVTVSVVSQANKVLKITFNSSSDAWSLIESVHTVETDKDVIELSVLQVALMAVRSGDEVPLSRVRVQSFKED